MRNKFIYLKTNSDVTVPLNLTFDSRNVVIEKNAPHMGGKEMAILDINLYTGFKGYHLY